MQATFAVAEIVLSNREKIKWRKQEIDGEFRVVTQYIRRTTFTRREGERMITLLVEQRYYQIRG